MALVARASNTGFGDIELDEAACAGPRVLAVAAYPRLRLAPGQETEVYIALRPIPDGSELTQRPSVISAGGH